MNTTQRIQAAEQRIKELQLLIREWKINKASPKYVALELVKDIDQKLAS